jgi:hypothetical protein
MVYLSAIRSQARACRFSVRLAAVVLALSFSPLRASEAQSLPSGDVLLAQVISQLPKEPLRLTGELIARKRHGVVLRRLEFEMFLNWGAVPSKARYVLRDAFGVELEQLTVLRDGGSAEFEYATGSPLTNAPTPDLFQSVQQTDVSWMDLALSFLWWKGAKVTGVEKVLDRPCYVVDVPAPVMAGSAPGADSRYASVRVWIDQEMRMLFQAEGRDAKGQAIRRLWVRSFKKFGDRWMIKDMEVQQEPGDHRTKLQMHDVQTEARASEEKAQP